MKQPRKNFAADGGRALRARQAMDMWTMRLRRTTAFDHMPTAFDH